MATTGKNISTLLKTKMTETINERQYAVCEVKHSEEHGLYIEHKDVIFSENNKQYKLFLFDNENITIGSEQIFVFLPDMDNIAILFTEKDMYESLVDKKNDIFTAVEYIANIIEAIRSNSNATVLERMLGNVSSFVKDEILFNFESVGIKKLNRIYTILGKSIDVRKNERKIEGCMRLMEEFSGINRQELVSNSRRQELVSYRCILSNYFRNKFRMPLNSIGAIMNRDHSSIIHLIKRHNDSMATDGNYASDYKKFVEIIRENDL